MALRQISGNQVNALPASGEKYHCQPSVQYRSLSISKQEIRLLCLHADSQEHVDSEGRQVIASTSLVSASLNDNMQYFALSYPWGLGKERDAILVDGSSQPIGSNLAASIRDINARRQGQPIYLWIDKLCINQDDLDEKAWQIRYMSKMIYSQAFETLVWLGMDSTTNAPDTLEILASLEHLTHDQFLFEMKQLEFEAHLENEKKLELVYIDPDCLLPTDSATPLVTKWTRLRSILSLPWWGRRWVIQDSAVNKSSLPSQVFKSSQVKSSQVLFLET